MENLLFLGLGEKTLVIYGDETLLRKINTGYFYLIKCCLM
jgi:hypothetical protein